MDMENDKVDGQTFETEKPQEHHEHAKKKMKLKLPPRKYLYGIGVVVVVVLVFLFGKSYFVAAMVNGKFISKASYIKEMERQAGQGALDSLIITSLIENKVKDIDISNEEIDAEIKKTEESLQAQGMTLADALAARSMTEKDYRKRVITQLRLEKMFADKTTVSEDEITKYLAANRAQLPKGLDQKTLRAQVADTIKQNKFNQEVSNLIDTMKAEANIKYYVKL